MYEILHQLIGSLSYYLQGVIKIAGGVSPDFLTIKCTSRRTSDTLHPPASQVQVTGVPSMKRPQPATNKVSPQKSAGD